MCVVRVLFVHAWECADLTGLSYTGSHEFMLSVKDGRTRSLAYTHTHTRTYEHTPHYSHTSYVHTMCSPPSTTSPESWIAWAVKSVRCMASSTSLASRLR